MALKETLLGGLGAVCLGLAFLCLFGSLVFVLADSEMAALEKKINAEYPEKVSGVLDIVMPAEIKNLTLNDVKTMCALHAAFNVSASSLGIPLEERDLDFICGNAAGASSVEQLKDLFISAKVAEKSSEVMLEAKKNKDAYANTYLPALMVLFLFFLMLSALFSYLAARGGVLQWLRWMALKAATYSALYMVSLLVMYFAVPGMVSGGVADSPDLQQALSQVPQDQRPAINILVYDAAALAIEWLQGVLVHFIMIYGVMGVMAGGAWVALSAAVGGSEEEGKGRAKGSS